MLKACELGLNPLAVHLDNGWNSELAQHNISKLIRTCKVDLFTHVINWKEYRNLQEAFFKANVLDIELLMDNAMLSVNYKWLKNMELNIYCLEQILQLRVLKFLKIGRGLKNDAKILKISNKFSNQKIETFPTLEL